MLREAMAEYAAARGGGLRTFVGMLAARPQGAGLAAALAEEMAADPLLDGGLPVDPGILFTPQPHKRARICVISLAGLCTPRRQQTFVGQLQMALGTWLRRQPAGDGSLRGLLVLDEAQTLAPARGSAACLASTLALVGPARRHGLGLVFATHDPEELHERIVGHAATHVVGLPTAGVFEVATRGGPFEEVATPMCLTHHPAARLTPEEVIARANTYPGA